MEETRSVGRRKGRNLGIGKRIKLKLMLGKMGLRIIIAYAQRRAVVSTAVNFQLS
jgi:hypothetical protein